MIIAGSLNLRILRGCTFAALELAMQDINEDPVDITGYAVQAQVRATCDSDLILDLNPSVTNGVNGIVTIPEIDDETTIPLPEGIFFWDMILEDGSDNRQQILKGKFTITCTITGAET